MNPLFKSLHDAVVVNTNRPNLRAEISFAITSATKELHNRGRFIRDIHEAILSSTNGGTTNYLFTIPQNKLVREIINVSPLRSDGLKGISLDPVDMFSTPHRSNWYKYNNTTLQINTSQPAQMFALSFLSFPKTDEENYDSWIGRIHPNYVTDLATHKILVMRNLLQQAQVYRTQVGEAHIPGSHIYNLLQENETVS